MTVTHWFKFETALGVGVEGGLHHSRRGRAREQTNRPYRGWATTGSKKFDSDDKAAADRWSVWETPAWKKNIYHWIYRK